MSKIESEALISVCLVFCSFFERLKPFQ